MKTKFQKFLLIFTIIFTILFTACNRTRDNLISTTKAKEGSRTTTVVNTEDIMELPTKTSADDERPAIATTAKKNTSAQATSPPKSVKQSFTLSEIVELYNKSANNIKPHAKIAIRNSQSLVALQDIPDNMPFASAFSKQFNNVSSNKPFVCNNQELIKKHFIINGKNYTSKMTEDIIKSATCTYHKGKYFVEIVIKNDPKGTQKYSSLCLPVLTPKLIADNAKMRIVKEKNIKSTCKDCIIKATIDKKTGNMLSLYYKMPTYVRANILGKIFDFSFYFEQDWSILW